MDGTELGKITHASVGYGGYQDCQIGVSFTFAGKEAWGVSDFWGFWGPRIKHDEHKDWDEATRANHLGMTLMRLGKILDDAKVDRVEQLVGVPVQVTFEGNRLKTWRILTEVR